MEGAEKFSTVKTLEATESELGLINQQALKPLKAEEVFIFRVAACDDQVDRENERFTRRALEDLAKLYVGKSFIFDHSWSAGKQLARIYAAQVEQDGTVNRLVLRVYMLRNKANKPVIEAVEGGIMREVSVGCAVGKARCSICGRDRGDCSHIPGKTYDGRVCHIDLDEAKDAYECSFVAVPAQPRAGVIKRYGGEGEPQGGSGDVPEETALLLAKAKQEQEEKRFGGIEV